MSIRRLYEMNDAYRVCALGSTCKESRVYATSRAAADQELAKGMKIAQVLDREKALQFKKFQADVEEGLAALDGMYAACAATPPSCAAAADFEEKVQHLLSLNDVLHELQPSLPQLPSPAALSEEYEDAALAMRAIVGQDRKTQVFAETMKLKELC